MGLPDSGIDERITFILEINMRTLNTTEMGQVAGAGLLGKLLTIGKTTVKVDVVAKPTGSTNVDVKSPLADVLVNVIWDKK
jgi:hypothetical protein